MGAGTRIKANHRYTYRPDGCEFATVTHEGIDENGRQQVHYIFDNGTVDYSPLEDFSPAANNGEPSFVVVGQTQIAREEG